MENERSLETLARHLEQNASVKNVFGEPIISGDKTIIPVAKIAFGLGGGYGQNKLRFKKAEAAETENGGKIPAAEGGGAGGGMYAMPKGVYEVSASGTRFIPADNTRMLLLGFALGIVLRGWLFRKPSP